MSFDRSPPPLAIELDGGAARRLALGAHAVAAALLLVQPLDLAERALLIALCAASMYRFFRRLAGDARAERVQLGADGRWRRGELSGRESSLRLIAAQRLPGVLWLRWRADGGRVEALVGRSDAAGRRLRMRLTLDRGPGHDATW